MAITIPMNIDAQAQMRLLQLVSPALPVGAYAYSQGLETAVERGWVKDEDSATDWIGGVCTQTLGRMDLPLLTRFHHAWEAEDHLALGYWSAFLTAMRESRELLNEDRQLATALARLLNELELSGAASWMDHPNRNYACLFALAAVRWKIPLATAAHGYTWSWLENQVAAAIKLVPLGQTAGQRILGSMVNVIPSLVEQALHMDEADIGSLSPGLAMASAWHETQYSRMFRS